jgi:hypothetical protein
VWVVAVSPDGTISAYEMDPNTAASVIQEGGHAYAAERDEGWSGAAHDVRAYDIADPASLKIVNFTVPNHAVWGEPGRAATMHVGDTTWALMPVRDEHVAGPVLESVIRSVKVLHEGPMDLYTTISTGPVIEVAGPQASVSGDRISAGATVRNVHHEPVTVRIDRLVIGSLVLESAHPYSSFEHPGYGSVRIGGETNGGYFGPSRAYGETDIVQYDSYHDTDRYYDGVNIIYSAEQWGRVFAYVQATDSITLAPGESKRIGATIYTACGSDPTIKMLNACGLGGASLSQPGGYTYTDIFGGRFYTNVELTLVVDGHPEWTTTVAQER